MKQSRTAIKELTAAYRAVLKHALIASMSMVVVMPAMAEDISSRTVLSEDTILSSISAKDIDASSKWGAAYFVEQGGVGIDNSVFENNKADTSGAIELQGLKEGDITKLIITNTSFNNNKAVTSSGAIETWTRLNELYIDSSNFENNSAPAFGAVSVFGKAGVNKIINSRFIYNRATNIVSGDTEDGGDGGAIFLGSQAKILIDNTVFVGNIAANDGGAVATRSEKQNQATSGLEIKKSTFEQNEATNRGGAVYANISHNTTLESAGLIDKSIFKQNKANLGGAIYNDLQDFGENVSNLQISNSYFNDNSAKNGGAVYNLGTITIDGGDFSENTATGFGGAVYSKGNLNVDGATFTNNTADVAGAISSGYNDNGTGKGEAVIKNSTFANNEAEFGAGAINNYGKMSIVGGSFNGNKTTGEMVEDGYANHNLQTSVDGGGAIFVGSASDTTINGVIFSGNESTATGGAISTRADWYSKTTDKTINAKENAPEGYDSTTDYLKANTKAKLAIEKSTFAENNATSFGGAVYNTFASTTVKDSTFTGNAAKQGGAIYNETVAGITLSGTNTFTGNKAEAGADIFNNGQLTIADGKTTIDGGIAGNGAMTIAEAATLNIGDATVEQKSITLDGNMIANLSDRGDKAIVTADEFTGNGKMSLIAKSEGEYKVFGDAVFGNVQVDVNSVLYNMAWNEDNTSVVLGMKSVQDIAADNNLTSNTSQTVLNLIMADSDKLNDFGLLVQEHLSNGNSVAVEDAHKAINPVNTPVVQSVASQVQGSVAKLTAERMNIPSVGRAGGDVDLTAGGVWAQGLFNKSKKNGEYNGYTRGVAAGIDGTINRSWTIGAGYAFNHSDVNLNSRDTEIDSNTLFLYGQYKPSAWFANATLNYTMSDYSEDGSALGVAIDADYKINAFGGQIMTGYDFANGLTPEAGVRYLHVDGDTYTNSLGIRNKIDDADYLTAILGGRYAKSFAVSGGLSLRPEVRLAAKYDLLSDDYDTAVTMPGINSYSVKADSLNRFGGEAGLGITMSYKELDLSLTYDIEFRKDYTSQTGMLKARYNF